MTEVDASARAIAWPAHGEVVIKGETFLLCPVLGRECLRIPTAGFGRQMASDAMDVHVRVSHRPWS